jgi:glycosyltransferase involved in cell wall biosynthesis
MKIFWFSTVPWGGSSYSVLTKRTVPELLKLGHEVTIGTWYGLQGSPQNINWEEDGKAYTATVLPSLHTQSYGEDTIPPAVELLKPDVVITCMDAWVLPPAMTQRLPFWAPWLPVDYDPAPEPVVNAVKHAPYPMAFSRWGTDLLNAQGVDARYVPCSAPANIYKPMDRAAARKRMGVPEDKFLVGMIAANKDTGDRKGFASAVQGFARFNEKVKDSLFYIHTFWNGIIEIPAMCDSLNLRGKVLGPDQNALTFGMYTDSDMASIMNAFDVLLNPALSEGFGLPMLEAQMCGIPVIANEFSTTKELLWAGWTVSGQQVWGYGAKSWRIMPDPAQIADRLLEAYETLQNDTARDALAEKARAGATLLDTKVTGQMYWKPVMADIEQKVTGGGKLELVEF